MGVKQSADESLSALVLAADYRGETERNFERVRDSGLRWKRHVFTRSLGPSCVHVHIPDREASFAEIHSSDRCKRDVHLDVAECDYDVVAVPAALKDWRCAARELQALGGLVEEVLVDVLVHVPERLGVRRRPLKFCAGVG